MKANKFFLGLALVGAILTACNKEPEQVTGPNGEVSYVAVNLNYSNQGTRAEGDPVFEYGEYAENLIKDVTFFFFDDAFAQYKVDGEKNYLTKTPTMQEGTVDHVEEISDAMLVIEQSKVTPPSYMIAVVNCPTDLRMNFDYEDLIEQAGAYNTAEFENQVYFVMANSVYVNKATGEVMYATPLTNANFGATATEAQNTPVEVYVERTAAKVRVNNFITGGTVKFQVKNSDGTNYQTVGADGKTPVDVYAQVIGWHVTDLNNQAYLLKNVDKTWDDTALGLTWNDAPRYRSYWATSYDILAGENPTRHPHTGNAIAAHNDPFDYYYENTNETADNEDRKNDRSQLVVLAKFFAGAEAKESTDIAEWWGVKYTLDGLKTAIANSLASEIYIATGTEGKYVSITPDYIDFRQTETTTEEAVGRYWSYAVLKPKTTDEKFYDALGQELTETELTAIFGNIRHAKIWSQKLGGYYYLDIEHLGTGKAKYGLVRNHLYEYTLESIVGLGTPVYDGTQIIIPEKPESDETYIAARLNIQAWRVVSQNNVTLQ